MTGSGTAADPYIIITVADLQNVENDLDAYYGLGGNIDASDTTNWNGGAGFLPIGQAGNFTGHFDGHGFTISDLFINRTGAYSQALFAYLFSPGVIQNVFMTGVSITTDSYYGAALVAYVDTATITNCRSAGTITGSSATGDGFGGLVGYIYTAGTISYCSSSCTVTGGDDLVGGLVGRYGGGTLTSSYATGNVSGDDYVGGLIGECSRDLVISLCYATGAVTASGDYAGGLIGYMTVSVASTIDDCYARGGVTAGGNYVGGFIGTTESGVVIDDCYSTGTVVGVGAQVGGFCGYNADTITNCFWDTETSEQATSSGGTGKTTAQMKTQATFTDAGWNFTTIWVIDPGTNNGYPVLLIQLAGELAGEIAIKQTRFHYFDAYGTERYVEGTVVA